MTRNLSVKQLGIITGVAALAVLAIWYVALFKPQTHRLTAARKADVAARAQISTLQQQVATLQALEKEIPADRVKLAGYQQAIPADPMLSTAIRQIQAAATAAGVSMPSLAPIVPSGPSAASSGGVPGAKTIPVTISSNGSYSQLTAFVTALTEMPRTMVVKSLSLSGTGAKMNGSISAEIFFTGSN